MLHEEEKLLVSRVCRRCGSNGSMGSDPIEARDGGGDAAATAWGVGNMV